LSILFSFVDQFFSTPCIFSKQYLVLFSGIEVSRLLGDSSRSDRSLELLARERTELESIEIFSSKCTDKSLWTILHHQNIKIVRLCRSYVSGEFFKLPAPRRSSGIEVLDLSGCERLSDTGLLKLLGKTGRTLKVLDISGTNVSLLNAASMISRLPLLEELNIEGCRSLMESSTISFLNKFGERLRRLNFRGNNVHNFESLSIALPALEILDLSFCCKLTESGALTFMNKTGENLKTLDLSWTGVTLDDVGALMKGFPVLKNLNLEDCENLTDSGAIAFLNKTGGTLKNLNLGATKVSFSGVETLTFGFPVLEMLNLFGCRKLTDARAIAFLNKTGGTLKNLNLGTTKVSFFEFDSLTTEFPVMEGLGLGRCNNLTDSGLFAFLNKSGVTLKTLDLSGTKVSFSDLEPLTTGFPVLENLDLNHCKNLSYDGLLTFLQKTTGNLNIYLWGSSVGEDGVKDFFPNLKVNQIVRPIAHFCYN